MRLAYAAVRGGGFEVHAWSTPHGIAATWIGSVPDAARAAGAAPVAGIELAEEDPLLRELTPRLRAYLEGAPFSWEGSLDWRGVTEFQREVYAATCAIAYGERRTYGQLARSLGQPQATRAIGNALHRNPFPLLVPCHRVVRARGGVGGFAAGEGVKRRLLALESRQTELRWEGESA